jgi:hypothetical protein
MRIRYMSDLHSECTEYQPPTISSICEDIVILAGDIGVGIEGASWAVRVRDALTRLLHFE